MKFEISIEILCKFMLRFAGRIIVFMCKKDTDNKYTVTECLENKSTAYGSWENQLTSKRWRFIIMLIDGEVLTSQSKLCPG